MSSRRLITIAALSAVTVLSFSHGAHGAAMGCVCPICAKMTADGSAAPAYFQIGSRWSSTSFGSTGSTGSPMTLSWGLVPDGTTLPTGNVTGESNDPSNLISYLDTNFGAGPGGTDYTQRPWFTIFNSSFERWTALSGITYVYQPADDGANMNPNVSSNNGVAGVRADVRIGGHRLDGPSGVLAYNYFPGISDMVIDTSETSNLTSSTNSFRSFRNILMHEAGHGLGFNHVESNNSTQLMEPFLTTSVDGPQFDDILAAHRNYGDVNEKNGGNDTAAGATPLGTFGTTIGQTLSIGTSTPTAISAISSTAVDFVSIDDESDADFYSFTSAAAFNLHIVLTPLGYSYNQGPQNGTQALFNALAQSDLILSLIAANGTTVLSTANFNGLGIGERLMNVELPAGTFYTRVTGATTDRIQMYRLDLTLTQVGITVPEPTTAALLMGAAPLALSRRRRAA